MDSKWIYVLVLELIIFTSCKPGPYKTNKPDSNPWSSGDWSHSPYWGGPWGYQDWTHDTTQRTRGTTQRNTKTPTEETKCADAKSPTPTLPQPTIRDVDIRFGDTSDGTTSPKPLAQTVSTIEDDTGPSYTKPEFTSETEEENKEEASVVTSDEKHKDKTEDSKDDTDKLDLTPGNNNESIKVDKPAALDATEAALENSNIVQENRWHVGIYEKELSKQHSNKVFIFNYKCGGSLIKENMVISAGHCFWSRESQQLDAASFKAAAGKMYREWDDSRDNNAQYADLKEVALTPMIESCRQPDLAFVTVEPSFLFDRFVRPVCISFDEDLEDQQLRRWSFATIASSTSEGCEPSERVHWLSLPYVDIRICSNNQIIINRLSYRICAGDANATQCDSNRGNGLVFFSNNVPYLRGVASFIPTAGLCMKYNTTSFTNLSAAKFKAKGDIKKLFDDLILEKCEGIYKDNVESQSDYEDYGDEGFGIQSIGSLPVPGLNGTSAPSMQWHVGVYSKNWSPYMQICGGTLVKKDVVLSAAHCFWDSHTGLQSSTTFAVAGGKLYRPWNDPHDTYAQKSDVSDITIPVRFRGSATSFQDDIAILRLESPFTYALGVQPACLDFSALDKEHLQPGYEGTVAGWGLTEENGVPSQRLNYLKQPYVDLEQCFSETDPSFHKYITSDKICAGSSVTGQALCRGDSGGGLIILDVDTPYLRGIASTAANNENLCNAYTLAAFTHVHTHRAFIRDHVPDVERECGRIYSNSVVMNPNRYHEPVSDVRDPVTGIIGPALRPESVRVDSTPYPVPYNNFVCNCNCKK